MRIRSPFIMAVLSVVILAGCVVPIANVPGSLQISVGDGVSRTIQPGISMVPVSYQVDGAGPNGTTFSRTLNGSSSVTVESLSFGEWTVTVTAMNAGGTAIGAGSGTATVHSNQTTDLSITVTPYEGFGTLNLSLSWPAADIDVAQVESTLLPTVGAARVLDFVVDGGGGTASFSASDVAAGYHTLTLKLLDNGALAMGAVDVVRIVKEQATTGGFAFTNVNKPGGTLEVNITPEMSDPLTVSIGGASATKPASQVMNLTASVAEAGVNATYVWYVNAEAMGIGESFAFGSSWEEGWYRIDVTAFSADGTRGGSATASVQVTSEGTPSLPPVGDRYLMDEIYGNSTLRLDSLGNIYLITTGGQVCRFNRTEKEFYELCTISRGGYSSGVKMGPNNSLYYTTSNGISKIDLLTLLSTVVTDGTRPGPAFPSPTFVDFVVDQEGNVYYCECSGFSPPTAVVFVDHATGNRSVWADGTLGSGSFPATYESTKVAFDNDGNVILFGEQQIVRIDKTTRDRTSLTLQGDTKTGSAMSTPQDVLSAGNNQYYILHRYMTWWSGQNDGDYDSALQRVTLGGTTATVVNVSGLDGSRPNPAWVGSGTMFIYPQGLVPDGDGFLMVLDSNIPSLLRVSTTSGNRLDVNPDSRSAGSGHGFARPSTLCFGPDGTLYVADFESHQHDGHKGIITVNPATGQRVLFSSNLLNGSALFDYYNEVSVGMTVRDGYLYLQTTHTDEPGSAAFYRINLASGVRTLVSDPGFIPDGLSATDTSGKLYSIDGTAIMVNDGSGSRVLSDSTHGAGPVFRNPAGIAVSDTGTVYVSDKVMRAVFTVHPTSGDRTLFSGYGSY